MITYDRPEDFRALNQRFGKLPEDAPGLPGPRVKDGTYPRRPWVYMGPGLWQDERGRVHVRLSHTTLGVAGVEDYRGETDPRRLPIAIWRGGDEAPATLTIRRCFGIEIRSLTIQHGAKSVVVTRSAGVALDHLVVNAGNYGIRVGQDCDDIRITNSAVDGGLPRWSFRSDRKNDYCLEDESHNLLGAKTSRMLIASHSSARSVWIEQCEFVNGHDLQLNGSDVTFTRNWIRNLNDDAIFVGKVSINMRILGNVIEQCLMAINTTSESLGQVYLHRNLIDLRLPTLGRRPHPDRELVPEVPSVELEVQRFGNLLKEHNKINPELNFSHNTVLVVDQRIVSSYNLFRNYAGPRRAYNNIFLAINRQPDADLPIAFLPQPTDNSETNGNCYFRIGVDSAPMFSVRPPPPLTFDDLHELIDTNNVLLQRKRRSAPTRLREARARQEPSTAPLLASLRASRRRGSPTRRVQPRAPPWDPPRRLAARAGRGRHAGSTRHRLLPVLRLASSRGGCRREAALPQQRTCPASVKLGETHMAVIVVRYLPDGRLDQTFGGTGIVRTQLDGSERAVVAMAVNPQNQVTVVTSGQGFQAARYREDGTLVTSFGQNGILGVSTPFPVSDAFIEIVQPEAKLRSPRRNGAAAAPGNPLDSGPLPLPTSRLAVVGTDFTASPDQFAVARYQPFAQADQSFNGGNHVTTNFDGRASKANCVRVDGDSRIYAAGSVPAPMERRLTWHWHGTASMGQLTRRSMVMAASSDRSGRTTPGHGRLPSVGRARS